VAVLVYPPRTIRDKKERHPRGDGVLSRVGLWTKEKGKLPLYLLAKSSKIVSYADAIWKRQEAPEEPAFAKRQEAPRYDNPIFQFSIEGER
jgi:hypothetical protein